MLLIVCTASKLIALDGQPLVAYTGDSALDDELSGFIEVVIAFGKTTYYEVNVYY